VTETLLVSALVIAVAAFAYIAGRLLERGKTVTRLESLLDTERRESRAYLNQLLTKTGQAIFDEKGEPVINRPPDNSPAVSLRPPFAQAELDWEAEEEAKKPITASQVFVPPLTNEEKQRMQKEYAPSQSN
jgi:hypothetical protein